MSRFQATALIIVFALTAILISASSNSSSVRAEGSSPQIVVKLSPGLSVNSILTKFSLLKIGEIKSENRYLLSAPAGSDVNALISSIKNQSGVEHVERNAAVGSPLSAMRQPVNFPDPGDEASIVGADAFAYQFQPLASLLQLNSVHAISQGAGVMVAVIDTGVDMNHPVLAGRIAVGGFDFVDDDSVPNDEPGGSSYGHGTFIAGLVLLVAPQAKILPLRAMAADGLGNGFDVAAAIRLAADKGARVINLSLGTTDRPDVVAEAIKYATSKNCLMVAAMGNDNSGLSNIFPANESNVMGVAATDFIDKKAGFSNYGQSAAVCAPGTNLIGPYPGGVFARWNGTSFSTALVSAEAALLFSAMPYHKRDEGDIISLMAKPEVNVDLKMKNLPELDGKLGKGRIAPLSAVAHAVANY